MDDPRASAIYTARVLEIGDAETHFGWVKLSLIDKSLMTHPIWAAPSFSTSSFWMPDPGTLVFVFFEAGSWNDAYWFGTTYPSTGADPNYTVDPVRNEGYFKWVGSKWGFASLGSATQRILDIATRGAKFKYGSKELKIFGPPPNSVSGYPLNRVLQTKIGHRLEFDDTPGRERITITSSPIKGSSHVIEVNSATDEISIVHSSAKFHIRVKSDGSLDLLTNDVNANTGDVEAKTGRVTLNVGQSFKMEDTNGNLIETTKSGVTISDKSGNRVHTTSGGVDIKDKAGSRISMSGGTINITARGKVVLNSGSRGVIREGDRSAPHTHVVVAPPLGGPCAVTAMPVVFAKGSSTVKAG